MRRPLSHCRAQARPTLKYFHVRGHGNGLTRAPFMISLPHAKYPNHFTCPKCQASYRLDRVKGDHRTVRARQCLICNEPFAATDGEHVLRYVLVRFPPFAT